MNTYQIVAINTNTEVIERAVTGCLTYSEAVRKFNQIVRVNNDENIAFKIVTWMPNRNYYIGRTAK